MPEKLWTIKDVAGYLKLSEDEVKRLVDEGEVPAYKIGDTFLRFRKEQIDAVRTEIDEVEQADPEHAVAVADPAGKMPHTISTMEREIKRRTPQVRQYDYTMAERIKDFFYFSDFYVLSFILTAVLVYIIIFQS